MYQAALKKSSAMVLANRRWLLTHFWLYILVISPSVFADEKQLNIAVKPLRCIALNQGQTCYQKVILQWVYREAISICLIQEFDTPIHCWEVSQQGELQFEFASETDQTYQLVAQPTGIILAEFNIEVAWVYGKKPNRARTWRLF